MTSTTQSDRAIPASATPTLSSVLASQRAAFAQLWLFSAVFNLLVLTVPLYMLGVFANVLTSRSRDTLVLLTVGAGIALLLQAAVDLVRARLLARAGMALDARLSPLVLAASIRDAAGHHRRPGHGLKDAAELRAFLGSQAIFTLFDAPFIPLYLLALFALHPALCLMAAAGSLALLLIAALNEIANRRAVDEAMRANRRAQARADELVRQADTVAVMGMSAAALRRWQRGNHRALSTLADAFDRASLARTLARLVRVLLQVGVYALGAWLYLDNQLMVGAIVAASLLMTRALAPLETAIGAWRQMRSALAAYQRLRLLLARAPTPGARLPIDSDAARGRLQVEQLVVSAPDSQRLLLRAVSFSLAPGEFLGVAGPSGAGKSTLAGAITGAITPRSGRVRLDGIELSAWNAEALGGSIGYLPEEAQLLHGTVLENIARLGSVDRESVLRAARLAGAHEMISALPAGYDTEVGEGGFALSAGQRQQIGLARALFGSPRLVVLDEPNAHLDADGEAALARALAQLKQTGVTLVVITHRPGLLADADSLLVLTHGAVGAFGPRAQVMRRITPMPARASAAEPSPKLQVVQGES
ncbi:MAG: type I secretion system permease/ATPase [Betaproteobacteria bacterium]|nr:type I secretion system permease/ATPase [Betaproteobacteria bacterium]